MAPLPSPVAQLPDIGSMIQATQARSQGLLQSAWAQLEGMGESARERRDAVAAKDLGWTGQGPAPNPQGMGALPPGAGNDDWAAMGFAENVPRSLIGTESGGNWGAYNDIQGAGGVGHDGLLQFSQARRAEAVAAGVIPEMSREQFRADRNAQIAASNWHFNDIDNRIRKAGYDRYVGQTIGGTPVSWDGMRAMAHLGGFGGLSSFIRSGGANNPADAFGTSLSAYGTTHSRG